MRHHLPVILVLVVVSAACAGREPPGPRTPAVPDTVVPTNRLLPLDAAARAWVDSALASLDTRGRAAQLVFPWMWGRYVPTDSEEGQRLRAWVEEARVGGIITSIGPPVALADKLNRLQHQAALPLLIAADLEAGPGMRLQGGTLLPYGVDLGGGTAFPPAMGIAATGDPSLAYEMGRITAAEARAVGIHITFAPVVDVNNNPANPIINTRSYGGDPEAVAEFAVAHIEGLQDHGLLATAKHFPGHGDVEDDTHLAPLILRISAARADTVELVPYRAAIRAGVAGVMTAHIAFPALGDSTLPATLSPRLVDSLLVRQLGFDGLVVTDALDMGAIVQRFGAGEAAVRALEAGADILLQPVDPFLLIDAVVAAVDSGRITPARLERSVRKVLEAKARAGLHRRRTVDVARVAEVVGSSAHREVAADAAERAVALLRDTGERVPLVPLRDRRVMLITYTDAVAPYAGRVLAGELADGLVAVERAALGPEPPPAAVLDSLVARADSVDLVIVAVEARVRAGEGAGAIEARTAEAISRMAEAGPLILVSLGNPYLVTGFPDVGTYVIGWSGIDATQAAVGRALLGRAAVAGRVPIGVPPSHERGEGLRRAVVRPARFAGAAANHGLRAGALDSLALAVEAAIRRGVTPGAVVAVGTSRGGVWIRAFGRTDREADAPAVTDSTLYDLASLTKVVATTSAVMRLVETGRMGLDAPLSDYLPSWPTGGWRDRVTIRQLLMHRAGLLPFLRFWQTPGARAAAVPMDSVVAAIAALDPPRRPGQYVYSDLGFLLLGAAVEAVVDTSLAAFVEDEVWGPLGMAETGFNPTGPPGPRGAVIDAPGPDTAAVLEPAPGWAALDRIAPTEVDTIFRHTHVHGQVHDENAWAVGGVAGHAGLFSGAPDLTRFAHMLLRAGRAEEARVFGPGTVARFIERQPGTTRALGWDVAGEAEERADGIAAPFTAGAFGHTGFTGTSLWVDPERDLYVIVLTNRVNPTRAQRGISELRRAVHEWAVHAVDPGAGTETGR